MIYLYSYLQERKVKRRKERREEEDRKVYDSIPFRSESLTAPQRKLIHVKIL